MGNPAKPINLLTRKDFDASVVGRILRWSLIYGRYIIVSTEIIVLLAFIYRFSLDRQITDLNEEIEQKSAIVIANQAFEKSFRNLQSRVDQIAGLFTDQDIVPQIVHHLEQITPAGVYFTTLSFKQDGVTIQATANTSTSLTLFTNNLKTSKYLGDVSITNLQRDVSGTGALKFQITTSLKSLTPENETVPQP
ncbi:MAG: hypothetical protein UV59_C0019G0010 [Candidatus Gottesmanbacteria bacterium GW2011_GWA1_43_11]|uniref:Fimbrial assembly family protein n=1 Tax=Candidatus Gottesmanbacteria bacterium GW2011_GWA1_43_11 TaxID=1618436 RepID=A0A0G1CF40_9BACT|nr:MAG: hypothetical protein UV59_C0019G0010 [Candidatus Gottesmanbacteria bacterium GW2011_GWA1_43_11]